MKSRQDKQQSKKDAARNDDACAEKRYIGDVGGSVEDVPAAKKAVAGMGMMAFALAVGFVVGLIVWAVFQASTALTNLLWNGAGSALAGLLGAVGLGSWWIPLAFCTLGGAIIGLFTWRFGGAPEALEDVMASVKRTGGYRLENPVAGIVGFLLPLVFGGSIGPEAGLTGIIAAACTRVGNSLKSAGLRVRAVTDLTVSAALSAVFATPFVGIVAAAQDVMPEGAAADEEVAETSEAIDLNAYTFRRNMKIALYTAAAVGSLVGVMVFGWIFGNEGGLPRFDGIVPQIAELWWALPCLVAGYAGALLFCGSDILFERLSTRMGDHPVLKPIIAGAVIGAIAIALPYVLFPGEEQIFELMESWDRIGAVVLIATGLVKCLATPLCLRFGWRGGHLFPCVFSGVITGYGIAALSGIDPMFCVAITTATLVAGVQRKPLVALGLLLMCFPPASLVWAALACVIGSVLPVPVRRAAASLAAPTAAEGSEGARDA